MYGSNILKINEKTEKADTEHIIGCVQGHAAGQSGSRAGITWPGIPFDTQGAPLKKDLYTEGET